MPVTYHFRTEWRFVAPVDRTWLVVLDIERYPGWWKNFRRVTVIRGDGKSVGSATTNPVLNLIAPLARGVLASNHTRVMANGYAALKPHVEAVPS